MLTINCKKDSQVFAKNMESECQGNTRGQRFEYSIIGEAVWIPHDSQTDHEATH